MTPMVRTELISNDTQHPLTVRLAVHDGREATEAFATFQPEPVLMPPPDECESCLARTVMSGSTRTHAAMARSR